MLLAIQSHLRQCEPQIRQSGQPQLWLEIALLDLLGQLRPGAAASAAIPLPLRAYLLLRKLSMPPPHPSRTKAEGYGNSHPRVLHPFP